MFCGREVSTFLREKKRQNSLFFRHFFSLGKEEAEAKSSLASACTDHISCFHAGEVSTFLRVMRAKTALKFWPSLGKKKLKQSHILLQIISWFCAHDVSTFLREMTGKTPQKIWPFYISLGKNEAEASLGIL